MSSSLSPAVRKIADEGKINLKEIKGTGKDGRILKGDLIKLMSQTPLPSDRKAKYGPDESIPAAPATSLNIVDPLPIEPGREPKDLFKSLPNLSVNESPIIPVSYTHLRAHET